ncbi:MAG: hypothetical protein EG825_07325 [Rhodocyclaceae bacterium]|nr:hypothetical protein [Rhodocyclaceae bacterium]
MTNCILRAEPKPDTQSDALSAASAGFFDLRAMVIAARALADEANDGGDLSRVLTQIANRANDLGMAADAAGLAP